MDERHEPVIIFSDRWMDPRPGLPTRFRAMASEGRITGQSNLAPEELIPHLELTQDFTDIEIVGG